MLRCRLMACFVPLLALALLPLAVNAIGPQKAKNNPHITPEAAGVELITPSGVANSWIADVDADVMDFVHHVSASEANISNALSVTLEELIEIVSDPQVALEHENKWIYVSHGVMVDLLVFIGYTREQAEQEALPWPDGLYARFVNIGK